MKKAILFTVIAIMSSTAFAVTENGSIESSTEVALMNAGNCGQSRFLVKSNPTKITSTNSAVETNTNTVDGR